MASSRRLVEMSSQCGAGLSQASDGRLRNDRLKKRGDELTQNPPGTGRRQAAWAERGESSSSSTSGSSKRMISR